MLINENTLVIKKSKFVAYYYEINDLSSVDDILTSLKKIHKKANHFPYAYNIDGKLFKTDDKEPHNSSGMPILKIIMENNLNNKIIIIVRYFGGIKLGVGGLYRSYLKSASEVIKKS